ncbi:MULTISPECIES: TetR/AcrR family transcriptional regulator [Rhizobium]|uniref:Transcriptional regulator n=1 Tax=Rhizobium favelukesii TaxID=348824 RepID=W6S9Z5_9HYPH|nr:MULTISPECIES: TetR/AcrR family transcriptional regulator [Rhizobium]MCS0462692.1 TetR/AcrR family transcriptional regulator [Rhizobium favelukesii]UFS79374.1 TetR/AcrR family transcriptional regulator [Rhizobium sp. T136]CDM62926.1 transcriptional regulator [Rhizobium favelukesii]
MSRTLSAKKSESLNVLSPANTDEKIPPRERIVSTAAELFREHGIRGIGVDAIADAALTNKMTLYRHFGSKDELVCETLRRASEKAEAIWRDLESAHPSDPKAQLRAWVEARTQSLCGEHVGCDLANAAIELKGDGHPAYDVIERHKAEQRDRLEALCLAAGAREPNLLADTLTLLLEGARVTRQAMGNDTCCSHFSKACNAAMTAFA